MHKLIKFFATSAFALAAGALCSAPALAAEPSKPAKPARVKAAKKAKAAKEVHPKAADVLDQNDPEYPEPDITDTKVTDYDCELGNKITIYQNEGDAEHIALRWKKRLHRLTTVGTTTGAKRFENKLFGLVWIGIPSKGMLLDSKLNRQLANECKNALQLLPPINEQLYPQPTQPPAQPPAVLPSTQSGLPSSPQSGLPSSPPSSTPSSISQPMQPAAPGQPAI